MTIDQLTQFVAEKVGGKVKADESGVLYIHRWENIEYDDEPLTVETLTPLSCPDLMLKGMEVCKYEINIEIPDAVNQLYKKRIVMWDREKDIEKIMEFNCARDLPLTFWQCWAELEKGE